MWQKIKNIYHLTQALLASIFFGFPSNDLIVVGVTGTDGKTTTCNMIYHILKSAGKNVSIISSLGAQINKSTLDTGLHVSTPSPWQLQKLLKKAKDSSSKYVVLEATSHGLDQNRLGFIKIHTAVITNITEEHLDYHGTWENYAKAKARLFENAKHAVLNLDDKSYSMLKKVTKGVIINYSITQKAEVDQTKYPISLKMPGQYNLSNALAASAACAALGIPKQKILNSLKIFPGVLGRFEQIEEGQDFNVIVDFAHTPNAMKNILETIKSQLKPSRLIVVFGSAGQRDKNKREKMGSVAVNLATISVITAEDPRNEKVSDISSEIEKGFLKNNKKINKDYFLIEDRKDAINFAIKTAKNNDTVAILGKGHEKSMSYGGREIPWDEFEVTRKAIKRLKNG